MAASPAGHVARSRAAFALSLLLACGAPVVLEAHAIVLESTPAAGAQLAEPPARIELRFNSRIEKRLSRVTLGRAGANPEPLPVPVDRDGGPADRLVLPVGAALAPGPYVVRYRVMAADGHISEGTIRFTVAP
jgi:methionine-rich copper-binding protein CopC